MLRPYKSRLERSRRRNSHSRRIHGWFESTFWWRFDGFPCSSPNAPEITSYCFANVDCLHEDEDRWRSSFPVHFYWAGKDGGESGWKTNSALQAHGKCFFWRCWFQVQKKSKGKTLFFLVMQHDQMIQFWTSSTFKWLPIKWSPLSAPLETENLQSQLFLQECTTQAEGKSPSMELTSEMSIQSGFVAISSAMSARWNLYLESTYTHLYLGTRTFHGNSGG